MRRGDVANSLAFDGVTLSVKDVEDVAGLPTTHSCEALAGNVVALDSPVVRRLRDGGFALLGRRTCPSSAVT